MAWCPAYVGPICSLCCSLDSRCHDMCKPKARLNYQTAQVAKSFLPEEFRRQTFDAARSLHHILCTRCRSSWRHPGADCPSGRHRNASDRGRRQSHHSHRLLRLCRHCRHRLLVPGAAHDSRVVAEEESSRQNTLLLKEIAAHQKTDAALQYAKETAEAANRAKSRYGVGLSTNCARPLNAVLGYAQILERDETIPPPRQSAIKVIRRSAITSRA